jgi:Transglutaminase-like superfamily
LPTRRHRIFRSAWWTTNCLLAAALIALIYAGGWEYSVRQYLTGFSDAVVPTAIAPEQKVEAILNWMRSGPPRISANPVDFSARDPETTLNYKQLLSVCGTATNAFLNLSRSAGLSTRRLLLLTPDRNTKHVVAEVLIDDRWVIVDPTFRVLLRDAQGHFLTRKELRDPAVFTQAIASIPDYPKEYSFDNFAHLRITRLPLEGFHLRAVFDAISPGWDEAVDWSLLLERESFFVLVTAIFMTFFFSFIRVFLAWYADHRLQIPRFHLREHILRAGAAFFSTPEIK